MMFRSIERLLQTAPFFLALTIGMALAWPLAAAPGQDPKAMAAKAAAVQKVTDGLMDKAGAGDFDLEATYNAYIKAGLNVNEANAATDEVRDAYKKWQKQNHKDDPNIAHGDWDMGQVFRGEEYPTELPVTNGCKFEQLVHITYPKTFKLDGPKEASVEANSTKQVAMTLDMKVPTPPGPPFPRPVEFICDPMEDVITLVHDEFSKPEPRADGSGTDIYTCKGWTETYTITLHAHQHPPVPPAPKDEVGGGKKKPKPACKNYWDHGDFFPTIEYADPTRCRDDIRDLATPWFGNLVEEEKVDPSKYEWLPKKEDIGHLSEKELLELKHKAAQQLRGGK